MAIVRGLGRFDNRSSFKTWSYRVATNSCLDELRRRKRRPTPLLDQPRTIDGSTFATQHPDDKTTDGIEQQILDRLSIDDAFPLIPEEFQAPVILRDVVGMSYGEIAETLDLAPGTVRSRIARGRRHLANQLSIPKDGNHNPTNERHRGRDV